MAGVPEGCRNELSGTWRTDSLGVEDYGGQDDTLVRRVNPGWDEAGRVFYGGDKRLDL